MATIHVTEIQKILTERGEEDARPWAPGGYIFEIRFDDPTRLPTGVVDEEFKDKIITADSHYGFVTIKFDEEGLLKAIEFS